MRAGINAKYKRRGTRRRNTRQFVLAATELRNELRRQIRLANVLRIMRWEMIPRQAKGTDPQFGPKIDLTVGIQDCMASGGGAADGVVLQCRGWGAVGWEFFEGGVERADGSDAAGGFEAGGRPAMEGEAGAGGFLGVAHVPVFSLHG